MVRTFKRAARNRRTPVYSISAASRLAGLPIWTLRWIEKHALVAPRRTDGNQRLYSDDDLDRLGTIRDLLEKKVNLAGIKVILGMRGAALTFMLLAALPGCGGPPKRPAPMDLLDAGSRQGVAAEAVRELAAGLDKDPTLASKAGGVIAAVGPDGVTGAAQALTERDNLLDMELAQLPEKERPARLKLYQADDAALATILSSELARLGPPAVGALLDQAAAKGISTPDLKRGPLMREVSYRALALIGEPAFPALVESLKHPALREAAAGAMARAGEPGLRLLRKMAGVPDKAMAEVAKRALKAAAAGPASKNGTTAPRSADAPR